MIQAKYLLVLLALPFGVAAGQGGPERSAFGVTAPELFGSEISITGMAGDQQAAAMGQACLQPATIKATYGTGCFMLQNTGEKPVVSNNRLVTTLAYRLEGRSTYALEGSIFNAGSAVQWLRDGLNLIDRADETETHARRVADTGGVYLVPAFTGLGAPYWDPAARGAILGLTRDSGISHIVRATFRHKASLSMTHGPEMRNKFSPPRMFQTDHTDWL